MRVNSSRDSESRTLARPSADKAKEFLTELANLLDETAAMRFKRRFGNIFLPQLPQALIQSWAIRGEEEDVGSLSQDQKIWKYWLLPLRESVRRLWIRNERDKRWGVFRILEKYFLIGSSQFAKGPVNDDADWLPNDLGPETICESIFIYLRGRTSRCGNPDCNAPYFFAPKRLQKYCSDVCARPAQQESKRKWWAANGTVWRRKHRMSRKKQNNNPNGKSSKRR
jgi:hypothetical protein